MNIKLGLAASENLMPEVNRDGYEEIPSVVGVTHQLLGGTRGQYYQDTKLTFKFHYKKLTKTDYDTIKTEFDRHAVLSLMVEITPDSGSYTTYTVVWGDPPNKKWNRDRAVISIEGTKILIVENLSFSLLEV